MNGTSVAIRVDVSVAIGGGHLQRCLSLAYALRQAGADVFFIVRDLGVEVRARLAAASFRTLLLPAPDAGSQPDADVPHGAWGGVSWREDAQQTRAVLAALPGPVSIVVVDHYAFDERWHRALNAGVGCDIAVIDDMADRPLWGRWLVDHNHHVDHRAKYGDRWPSDAELLGGPRFALLGPSFAEAPRYEVRDVVHSIGIFLGSMDPDQLSAVALRACREVAHFAGPIEVVTTCANPHLQALQQVVAASAPARLVEDLPDLADFFARHDLQIGAGGGATWERCCIGAPSVLLTVAANQEVVVPALDALGVAVGVPAQADVRAIGEEIRRLVDAPPQRRHEMSRRAQRLVDGHGARRVALALLSGRLALRAMTESDAEFSHRWRNHESTRKASRDPAEIDFAFHQQWLRRSLGDRGRMLWVAHVGTVDVGVIRFDADRTEGECEVSLYLDPALHGLGLGAKMLLAGERACRARAPSTQRFRATVMPHNHASRRLFERAGYVFEGDTGHKRLGDAGMDSMGAVA